jgi:hypothetical protein
MGALFGLMPVLPDKAVWVRAASNESLLSEARGPLTWQVTTSVYGVPVYRVTETGNWKHGQLSIESKLRPHRIIVRVVFATVGAMVGLAIAFALETRTRRSNRSLDVIPPTS